MIVIFRKNLSCSFVCKSHVPFSLNLHFFSASSTGVYDVLVHKHQFSPQVASLAASDLSRFRSAECADSILSFLKENDFSATQLERMVKNDSRILTAGREDGVKLKIKIFQDFGLSSQDIAMLISRSPTALHLRVSKIIHRLSLLKGLLGSNDNVARLLGKSGRCLTTDLEKTLVPNVEFLKSCGIPSEWILLILYRFQRCLLTKPDIVRRSVDKVKELGVSPKSKMFIHAVRIVLSMSEETWEPKFQAFRDMGFSDVDILTMFRKMPLVFNASSEKKKKVTELLLATGKFNISCIVTYPTALMSSVERRIKPRLRILGILESKNLIKKWPSIGTMCTLTDAKFFDKFIGPYSDELSEAFVADSISTLKRNELEPSA